MVTACSITTIYCSPAGLLHTGRFYIIQELKRQGAKCRLLVLAKHRLPVHPAAL